MGQGSTASGATASAYGQGSLANGDATTAIGQASIANATGATAIGQGTTASGARVDRSKQRGAGSERAGACSEFGGARLGRGGVITRFLRSARAMPAVTLFGFRRLQKRMERAYRGGSGHGRRLGRNVS